MNSPPKAERPPRSSPVSRLLQGFRRARSRLAGPPHKLFWPLIMLAALASLFAATWYATTSIEKGLEFRAFEQHRSDSTTEDLDTTLIAQSFRSPSANLSSLDVQLSKLDTLPTGGRIRLLAGDGLSGAPVYQAALTTASFARNPYLTISFPPVAASLDQTYTLVLETPGTPLKSAMGVRYSSYDTLSSGRMYTSAGPGRGDLVVTALYHYEPGTLLSDTLDAVVSRGGVAFSVLLLLLLPGLALLVWLPNSLTIGQRLLAAPGLTALALPVLLLVTRAVRVSIGAIFLWLLVGAAACALLAALWRQRAVLKVPRPTSADLAFWGLFSGVLALTLVTRLLSLRDSLAGLGLDAYHHTLVAELFVRNGGIPSGYEPYAPLSSFSYHFGFHALTAATAWISSNTSPTGIMSLMPQVGQIADTLPVLTLTLFGWRVLGNRWAGLGAGALAGLMSIFPAFYVNWSRYTQGLGLALLPLSWVLLLELLERQVSPTVVAATPITWRSALRQSGPYMLAVLGAAGLALTHYRIALIYAGFVAFYLLWRVVAGVRAHEQWRRTVAPLRRSALVAALSLATLSPWLVNLWQNFTVHLLSSSAPATAEYFSLEKMLGPDLLGHPSLFLMFVLSFGALPWVVKRRDPLPLLSALTWLALAIWSNPYLLPVRLPYAGYLDPTTLATSAWLPLSLLAGYTMSEAARWVVGLGDVYKGWRRRSWRLASMAMLGLSVLLGGLASGLSLSAMVDPMPYIARGDAEVLAWMGDHLPHDAYVLANPFAFTWDPPPQAVQGSDAGLWVPFLTGGIRSSVPPTPAYNERPEERDYLAKLRELVRYEPLEGSEPDWKALKTAGITHIFVGSRGGKLDVPLLLKSDHTTLLFHRDAAWIFALR